MADVYGGPFGGYVATAPGIINAAAKTGLQTIIDQLAALLSLSLDHTNDVVTLVEATSAPKPDFDKIPVELREKLGVELLAIFNSIDAAAEA